MKTIILLVVACIAVAFLVDTLRSSRRQLGEGDADNLTADEALPTQTGRYRAQQALAGTKPEQLPEGTSAPTSEQSKDEPEVSDEQNPLPDPFDRNH